MTPRDDLTDAINTTRGRAMQNLVQYGFWLRNLQSENANVSATFSTSLLYVLKICPLQQSRSTPSGSDFNRLYALDSGAAAECTASLFPERSS